MTLILASTSPIRSAVLTAAGVAFEALAPKVDETEAKLALPEAADVASELACAKALAISTARPAAWVIGSDSVIEVDGRRFDKPATKADAAEHLRFFSGKTMHLTSAVALARKGRIDWRHRETVRLHVRPLSETFIASYLTAEWPQVAYCVGVFRMEGLGVQLFEAIEGDHFTILGMPLLPLLGALRERKLLPA